MNVEYLVYVVVWPDRGLIKAGYTSKRTRWMWFASYRDGVIFKLTEFPSEKLARAHEASVLALLDYTSRRAFESAADARERFGRDSGWSEFYWLPVSRENLAAFASWMPYPYFGDVRRTPEQALDVLEARADKACLDARESFAEAVRRAKYARLRRESSAGVA